MKEFMILFLGIFLLTGCASGKLTSEDASDMATLPPGEYIVQQSGHKPLRTRLSVWMDYLHEDISFDDTVFGAELDVRPVQRASLDGLMRMAGCRRGLHRGMFDG